MSESLTIIVAAATPIIAAFTMLIVSLRNHSKKDETNFDELKQEIANLRKKIASRKHD